MHLGTSSEDYYFIITDGVAVKMKPSSNQTKKLLRSQIQAAIDRHWLSNHAIDIFTFKL